MRVRPANDLTGTRSDPRATRPDHPVDDEGGSGGCALNGDGSAWYTAQYSRKPPADDRGFLLACFSAGRSVRIDQAVQWNESPQAQEFCALGLSIVKPCFSMVSTKSMTAPSR